MSFKWKREEIEKLILCVQQNPCLYNVKCTEYLDRLKKAQAFNNILAELAKTECTITLEEIKRKWRNLRTQFMKEQRLVNQSKKSGSGITDIYIPKLWCFHQLSFLQPHLELRATVDNTGDEENSIPETCSEDAFIEEPPKKRQKSALNSFRSGLDNIKTMLQNKNKKEEKKFAWLGNLVTIQMESISPQDQDDAAWEVQCVMRKYISKSSRERNDSASSSSKDILQLSMESVFDDEDFI